jgi:hypothetical protein
MLLCSSTWIPSSMIPTRRSSSRFTRWHAPQTRLQPGQLLLVQETTIRLKSYSGGRAVPCQILWASSCSILVQRSRDPSTFRDAARNRLGAVISALSVLAILWLVWRA